MLMMLAFSWVWYARSDTHYVSFSGTNRAWLDVTVQAESEGSKNL
jgi:hypothetical protein